MTRINARLDAEAAADLELVRSRTAARSVTEALKYSLHEVAGRLRGEEAPGRAMAAFLASDYIACAVGPEDVSDRYKDVLESGWGAKHAPDT